MGETHEFQLDVGDVHLYGVKWQTADPAYIAIMVHGYGDHIRRYDRLGAFLNENGAVVFGIDQRGHGRSPGDRAIILDFDDTVDDYRRLVAVARSQYPSLPVVLIGHSMGGLVSSRYAQRFPDDLEGVVVAGAVLSEWEGAGDLLSEDEYPDVKIPVTELSRDSAVNEAFREDPLTWPGEFREESMKATVKAQEQLRREGQIQIPYLWMHGGQDAIVRFESAERGFKMLAGTASQAHPYPEAMHELFNELNTDEVLTDVSDFIRSAVLT